MDYLIDGIEITPLKIIQTAKGNVMHALKATEQQFESFGEAYFSQVYKNDIKGWKKHTRMKLNLVVPVGAIQFVMYDDRTESQTFQQFYSIQLSKQHNYARLTVNPGIWLAFRGLNEDNLLLNLASIIHDPQEAENLSIEEAPFKYNW